MWIKYTLIISGFIVLAGIIIVLINGYRNEKSTRLLVSELHARADTSRVRHFTYQDLTELPSPVQRYLKKAVPEGQLYIHFTELHQEGCFNMSEDSEKWQPFTAAQHFTTNPPGFVWDAGIKMAPLMTAKVLDIYSQGAGMLRAKMFNTLTVANASRTKEMDTGELLRYLAESVWFPTALLPGQSLRWEAVDDSTAIAVLRDGDNAVSLTFHFNDDDEIIKTTALRYRLVNRAYELTPWTGYYSDYQRRNGFLIPIEAKVEWNLPQGSLEYWRGRIVDIRHHPVRQSPEIEK